MADRAKNVAESLRLMRIVQASLGSSDSLRLRTLVDMLVAELESDLRRLTDAGQA